jgi:predicted glycosyltransferase
MNIKHITIGRHYGKSKVLKVAGLIIRSLQLIPKAFNEKPDVALSHGSRAQIMTASALGIPSIVLSDYEYTRTIVRPDYLIVPEIIPDSVITGYKKCVYKYPGIKEDVYAANFSPDPSIRNALGISEDELLVTARPPATEAHYHNPESDALFKAAIDHLGRQSNVRIVILPRNVKKETAWIKSNWPKLCDSKKIVVSEHVLDGLNLIWHSDLVVSGGGTMNREAAALGVPVYSVFRSKIGAVDRYLSENGRLTLLENVNDIRSKMKIVKSRRSKFPEPPKHAALDRIIKIIGTILKEVDH